MATIVSVAAILRFAERYSWVATLAIAIGAAAACHVLFERWLGAILPSGTLWERFTAEWTLAQAIVVGFSTALTWSNLTYCFIGVFVGTAVGVLPGLGPVATISLLLPFSFTMDIASALILMAGVFYGAQYGGSITAILVRIPGEASAVVTCLDGYAMARQGPRRSGARHRGVRLVHRRRAGDDRAVPGRAGARQRGARVRPGRIHRAGAARTAAGHAALLRLAGQRAA